MKKLLMCLIVLVSIPTFAQEWNKTKVDGDELKGTKDKTVLMYNDSGNIFQVDDNEEKIFILKTSNSFFDFTSIKGTNNRFITLGLVGLYDKENNLIEKLEITFEVYEPATICYPNKYTKGGGNNYKRSKKVIDFIKNSNGYVRFILPLHNQTTDFDFKVPTLKQN